MIDKQLDLIYDEFDLRIREEQFGVIESHLFCLSFVADLLSNDFMIGVLTATLPIKDHIRCSSRSGFFSRVKAVIEERGEMEPGLLEGLE